MRRSRGKVSFASWGHCHVGGKPAAEGSGPSGGGPGLLTVARRLSVIHEPARGVAQLGRARTPVTPGTLQQGQGAQASRRGCGWAGPQGVSSRSSRRQCHTKKAPAVAEQDQALLATCCPAVRESGWGSGVPREARGLQALWGDLWGDPPFHGSSQEPHQEAPGGQGCWKLPLQLGPGRAPGDHERKESVHLRGHWASPGCTWSPDRGRLGGSRNTWKVTFAPFTLRQR